MTEERRQLRKDKRLTYFGTLMMAMNKASGETARIRKRELVIPKRKENQSMNKKMR